GRNAMDRSGPHQTAPHEPGEATPARATDPTSEAETERKPYARPRLTEYGRMPAVTLADAGSATPSDRNIKEQFEAVDPPARRGGRAPPRAGPAAPRARGPRAFPAPSARAPTDRHIFTLDATGVALAAIQGLHALVRAQQARLELLERELRALRGETAALRA